MDVAPAIDLTTDQRRTVLTLLNRHLPSTTVWAYGSRVKWTSHPASDLDLVAFAKPDQSPRIAELREAFDDSFLPFRVDLFVWDDVPKDFRRRIEADHVVLAGGRTAAPTDWPMVALGDCASLVNYKVDPANCGDLPYIGLEHIGQGTLSLLGIGTAGDVESTKTAFRAGDILFGKLRPYFRKVVRPNFDGICSTDIWVVRPKAGVDAGYLFYLMASKAFVGFASQGSEGTRMPRAKWEHVAQYAVRLPSVSEQCAIARVLNPLDDKIELNRRMAETLEETVRMLFKSLVVKAGSRCEGTLADIASLNSESWIPATAPETVAYIDLSNTKWGVIESVKTYAWYDAPSRARRVLRPGDTIVGTVRPANGSHALVGVEGLTGSTGFAVLRPKEDFDALFVWCAATSKGNIDRLAQLADGGAYPAVSPQAVAATGITLADVAIRKRFSDLATPLAERMLGAYSEANQLAGLRDTLLPKLLSDEVRIRDAEKLAEAAT